MPHGKVSAEARDRVVGLIPAGGVGARMSPMPCSKEILPVGIEKQPGKSQTIRIACSALLRSMHLAGVGSAYVILRNGKWDVPAYLGNGSRFGISLSYLVTSVSYGVPFTLQEATPFIEDVRIAFGFPDVIFRPLDAFARLLELQRREGSALTLGLFPVRHPESADVVECDEAGRVQKIHVKPASTNLDLAWMLAVWSPAFTEFMRGFVEGELKRMGEQPASAALTRELYAGHVFQAAVADGWSVNAVTFNDGECIDIGTMEGWKVAMGSGLHGGNEAV